jgi:hypothetical protein
VFCSAQQSQSMVSSVSGSAAVTLAAVTLQAVSREVDMTMTLSVGAKHGEGV